MIRVNKANKMDGQWDLVISSLQDIFNANEVQPFDEDLNLKRTNFDNLSDDLLQNHLSNFQEHMENVNRASILLKNVRENLEFVIDYVDKLENEKNSTTSETLTRIKSVGHVSNDDNVDEDLDMVDIDRSKPSINNGPVGRSYWISQFNTIHDIKLGSNVAYKPKKSSDGEWFHCEVLKVSSDGTKYEVKDPEPDEFGSTGKVFKCTWKDIILIPSESATRLQMLNYANNTKVLARYPETTTFYPAVVMGNKRDGTCRLKFDGEEEVDKETEVPRRFVLPLPNVSAKPAKK